MVKLCDFGLASQKKKQKKHKRVGTYQWMAPEVIRNEDKIDEKADVYSFAVVMWELTTHKLPYRGMNNLYQIIAAIASGQTNPIPKDAPPRFSMAIKHCWFEDPTKRPSAKQLAIYLADKTEKSTLGPGS